MNQKIVLLLTKDLKLVEYQVLNVLKLLEDGATVPFIARYRKELTNSLDEEIIREIDKTYTYYNNLENRKEEVIRLIDEKGLLTDKLRHQISDAQKLQKVEDLYLPYKEKKKTKATDAIKNGLEPLALLIENGHYNKSQLFIEASNFINENIKTEEEAITGACYIIAEKISEVLLYREKIRKLFFKESITYVKTTEKKKLLDVNKKYEIYYDFVQKTNKLPSYRILAFNRGEKQKILNVKIKIENEPVIEYIFKKENINNSNYCSELIKSSIVDSLERLILPSMERERRSTLTTKAENEAIELFSNNLEALLLQPKLKNKIILGVDPAFRTGCKLAVIDELGKVLNIDVIYPHPNNQKNENLKINNDLAFNKIKLMIEKFNINQIVIGNGTASRETERFLKKYINDIPIYIVSESGASVYSASVIAKEEFPNLEVEKRSAISIARRTLDPMAELVKIDPKAIGVGQYQHDVNQKILADNLDFIMIKNINKIGVNLNTSSAYLLNYVSGLDKTISKNIIEYREEFGEFKSRSELKKVKRLGPKAFEQSAGFLVIENSKNKLDMTFIHPEKYGLSKKIISYLNLKVDNIGDYNFTKKIQGANIDNITNHFQIEKIIIEDILLALASPLNDIRDDYHSIEFESSINSIENLTENMKVKGQVRNIVQFGAFVDIGIKQDALIHISKISNTYVNEVKNHLKIGDILNFSVISIDLEKGKVQLSLKE